jgi:hypothetical protein
MRERPAGAGAEGAIWLELSGKRTVSGWNSGKTAKRHPRGNPDYRTAGNLSGKKTETKILGLCLFFVSPAGRTHLEV